MKPIGSTTLIPVRSTAFTLIELVVVLAMIALLLVLRLSALAEANSQTKIAQCAGNLRQFAAAMHIYAGEFNDQLPTLYSGNWMIDMRRSVADFMVGVNPNFQKICYCPGTSPRFTDADNLNLWMFAYPNYRVLGYVTTQPGAGALFPTNANASLTPQAIAFGPTVLSPATAFQRVLVADETMSLSTQHDPSQRASYEYVTLNSSGPNLKPLTSAHLNGRLPAGGNLAMLDGHTEWRPFENMSVRGYGGPGNGIQPTCWW